MLFLLIEGFPTSRKYIEMHRDVISFLALNCYFTLLPKKTPDNLNCFKGTSKQIPINCKLTDTKIL